MTRREAELAKRFREKVLAPGFCVMCGTSKNLQPHHVLERSRVKHALLRKDEEIPVDIYWDPRNGIALDWDCHQRHHGFSRRLSRRCLPASAFEYAEDHGLTWLLDREYPEGAP